MSPFAPPPKVKLTCRGCLFFDLVAQAGFPITNAGFCRRNAPRGQLMHRTGKATVASGGQEAVLLLTFPLVTLDDWCGEHLPRQSG